MALVMALRWRRIRRSRPLRVEIPWVLPVICAVVVAAVFIEAPPSVAAGGCSALALIGGAVAGWYRGRIMRISVDPETHALSQQASPAAFFLLAGRSFARQELGGGYGAGQHAMLATEVAMAFALGLIAATRIEMVVRACRLLAAARTV